jgi:hypothetical protein
MKGNRVVCRGAMPKATTYRCVYDGGNTHQSKMQPISFAAREMLFEERHHFGDHFLDNDRRRFLGEGGATV